MKDIIVERTIGERVLCSLGGSFSFSGTFDGWCVGMKFPYMAVNKIIPGKETLAIWTGKRFLFPI
jgi:hypothetical protein